jgi:internalin A
VSLQQLYLSENQLGELTVTIGQCTDLKQLYLRSNPSLTDPPPEIIHQGTRAILGYQLKPGQIARTRD